MSESVVEKKPEEEKTKPVPEGNKDAFDALLKAAVPPSEVPPEEKTSDEEPYKYYAGNQTQLDT